MSGEVLHSTQFTPSSEIVMDDWVRALAFRLPSRKPAQLAQLQFHWRKPPPAAEPRIWIFIICSDKQSLQGPIAQKSAPAHRGQIDVVPRLWSGAAHGTTLTGQRLAKYMVTSKPIRRSV